MYWPQRSTTGTSTSGGAGEAEGGGAGKPAVADMGGLCSRGGGVSAMAVCRARGIVLDDKSYDCHDGEASSTYVQTTSDE